MAERVVPPGHGDINILILQALVRKLIEKRVLSPGDVHDLLFDAAERFDIVGDEQTPQAARNMVEQDLAPAFLGEEPGG